jgi:hypothetical protein
MKAPRFYAAFAAMLLSGAALVGSGVKLVRLTIAVGVLNALLLPIVLGFLYLWHVIRCPTTCACVG